jgi:tetratricopeptide (TPR) repeat protein
LFERTLTDRERILGDDHPHTLTCRHNLAYAYRSARRLDEAIALFERTLTDYERVLGDDHPKTLTCRHNLAYAYEPAGRLDEAIPLYERTLTDRERVLGADHPDTLNSRHNSPTPMSRRGASTRRSRCTSAAVAATGSCCGPTGTRWR